MKWKTIAPPQRCPNCDAPLAAADLNIKEGVALCPECGELHKLSQLRLSAYSVDELLARVPSGCMLETTPQGLHITASIRSLGGFLVTLAISLFWNGITGMFVAVAAAGIYTNVVGPLPDWFPMFAVKNGKINMNDGPMTLGQALGLCVFLIPFVLIGTAMLMGMLLYLRGRVTVVVEESASYVATGFRLLNWKKHFDPASVVAVVTTDSTTKVNGETRPQIELTADRTVKFGTLLTRERFEWLWAVLHEVFIRRSGSVADVQSPPWLRPRR